jgi:hypothetical protein
MWVVIQFNSIVVLEVCIFRSETRSTHFAGRQRGGRRRCLRAGTVARNQQQPDAASSCDNSAFVEPLFEVTCGLQNSNHVGDAGACQLGKGLKSNMRLKQLWLVSVLSTI